MKKLFVIILAVVLCVVLFSACVTIEKESENTASMFVLVEKGYLFSVYYHRETKVLYVAGGYNCTNFTVLVNADGTPMLWED